MISYTFDQPERIIDMIHRKLRGAPIEWLDRLQARAALAAARHSRKGAIDALVDPAERTLEACELSGTPWTDGATARIRPFEAIELAVGTLLPRLR